MHCPFPGMDPYLERSDLWPDVHLSLIIFMKDALNGSLPAGYAAVADRFVWIHEPDAIQRTRVKPNIAVFRPEHTISTKGASLVTAPLTGLLPAIKREGSKYLKILDVRSRRVVTAIELLSPSNKQAGPDREAFLTKRTEYLNTGINLIEIDLHRAGQRLPMENVEFGSDYYVLVCRASHAPQIDVWPFSVRDPFPTIPVPLSEPEPSLDLGACFERVYQGSRYREEVNYQLPPDPPLSEADATWARELLAKSST